MLIEVEDNEVSNWARWGPPKHANHRMFAMQASVNLVFARHLTFLLACPSNINAATPLISLKLNKI